MTRVNRWTTTLCALALLAVPPALAADDENDLEGSVELLWRNVSLDGSQNKFDEDFDGLDSGLRLGSLALDWRSAGSGVLDYATVDLTGLGGDPYERASLSLGRQNEYELTLKQVSQDYRYNLFELVPDEDGATWDSRRQMTDLDLQIYPTEKIRVFARLHQVDRSGTSLFMKDIERNLFQLETPLDAEAKRYSVGVNFEIGKVDLLFRQSLRRYDNRFENTTEGDVGLEQTSALYSYDWSQHDTGGSDWTTLSMRTPIGKRVDLTVRVLGSFLGDEEIRSRVDLQYLGLDSGGDDIGGTCAMSGADCSSDATCDAIMAGDVCIANTGTSRADLEGDTLFIEGNLSVELLSTLDLQLQYRSVDRDLEGTISRDLDGDGTFEDPDGDSTPGSTIRRDYGIDTVSAILDYRPNTKYGVRGGYRLIQRDLTRDGFGSVRDTDYDSGDDKTLIFGFWTRPVDWFKFNADYEDGDVDQPFNAVAPQESEHLRARASFMPQTDMRIDLGYLDFDKMNTASDIRDPGSNWFGSIEGTSYSISFFHNAAKNLDYLLRYAEQEIDSVVGITFDTGGFGAVETGSSIFDNDNTQLMGQVNFRWGGSWRGYVRYWTAESDGNNIVDGDVATFIDTPLDQELMDAEAGLTYTFPSGIFVGASMRVFDYNDLNDLLDYDGQIFALRGGLTF